PGLAVNKYYSCLHDAAPSIASTAGLPPVLPAARLDTNSHGFVISPASAPMPFMQVGSVRVQEPPASSAVDVGPHEPYGITASLDPTLVAVTDRADDGVGLGIIKEVNGPSWQFRSVPLNFQGPHPAYFDVNNGEAVAILPDFSYAFVAGMNRYIQGDPGHDPDLDPKAPAGGNVGIIKDPFGLKGVAKLVE